MTHVPPLPRAPRRSASAALALAFAGLTLLGSAVPASGEVLSTHGPAPSGASLVPAAVVAADAETDEPTVTWAVQPADEDGPDGRRWIEIELDPGAVVTEHLAVRNFGEEPVTFTLSAADGYLTDRGRFNMLSGDQESVDGGTWIDVQESVTVPGSETTVVPFTITVPADATPGDHPAGIAASIQSEDGTVGMQSRVGFRVMMRTTGDVEPVLAVPAVRASYEPSWNPFAAGSVHVSYDVDNEGNIQLGATSDVTTSALFGLLTRETVAAPIEEVLPGGSTGRTVDVDQVWPLGPVTTTVTLTPVPAGDDEIDVPLEPVTVSVTTWAIPWPQLLLVAIVVVLVIGVRDDRRRRRKRLEDMLARARDEGRRAATGDDASSGTEGPASAGATSPGSRPAPPGDARSGGTQGSAVPGGSGGTSGDASA